MRSRIEEVRSARICAITPMGDLGTTLDWLHGPSDLVICCNEDMNPGSDGVKESVLDRFLSESRRGAFPLAKIWPRVNAVGGELWRTELPELYSVGYRSFVIPKVETAADVLQTEAVIEKAYGPDNGSLYLAMIETRDGISNLCEILRSSRRIAGVVFGREDFRSSMGIPLRSRSEIVDLIAPGSLLVREAARAEVAVIDGASDSDCSLEDLAEDADFTAAMGFSGKLCVTRHTAQAAWRGFSPDDDSVRLARAFLSGAVEGDITEPMRSRARGTLALHKWSEGEKYREFKRPPR